MALPLKDTKTRGRIGLNNDGQLIFTKRALYDVGSEKMRLTALIDEYREKRLSAPPHQRYFIWTQDKIDAWHTTLLKKLEDSTDAPMGFMATYQLRDTGEYFLNDGFQRLTATLLFLERDYKRYKISAEVARDLVYGYHVIVIHNVYDEPTQALYWFQMMQLGTALLPYDFCKGFLTYLQSDVNWMPTLEDYHAFMKGLGDKYGPFRVTPAVFRQTVYLRHDYDLLWRWIARPKSATSAKYATITAREVALAQSAKGNMIEQKLGVELKRLGFVEALNEIKRFEIFLDQEAAVINEIKQESPNAGAKRELGPSAFRWLLSAAIWRRNNGLPNDETWRDFLRLIFLNLHQGYQLIIFDKNGTANTNSLSLQFKDLNRIARVVGHAFYANYNTRNGR